MGRMDRIEVGSGRSWCAVLVIDILILVGYHVSSISICIMHRSRRSLSLLS